MGMAKYALNSGEPVPFSVDRQSESVQAGAAVSAASLIKGVQDPALQDAFGRGREYGPGEIQREIDGKTIGIMGRPAVEGLADGDFAWRSEVVVSIPCVDEGNRGSFA